VSTRLGSGDFAGGSAATCILHLPINERIQHVSNNEQFLRFRHLAIVDTPERKLFIMIIGDRYQMPTVEVNVYQTAASSNAHPELNQEIADLIRDTFSEWPSMTYFVSADAHNPDPPSEIVEHSGSGNVCYNEPGSWADLVEWWRTYGTESCLSGTAPDSNILITHGDARGEYIGKGDYKGQYCVVEAGPLTAEKGFGDWAYDGTRISSDYQFGYAVVAVHEMGHNVGMWHRDGRVDGSASNSILTTPMTNFYGDNAIEEGWDLTCDDILPSSSDAEIKSWNVFSDCERGVSYF